MKVTIALAGNPNSGKTTMFNSLTGAAQYVGNWPGVTVEKKVGRLKGSKEISVVDLPGTYSLSPYSPEEVVSRDFLLSGGASAILNIVDGTNLERNLYLTSQMAEVGLPMVVALNMADLLEKGGHHIDVKALSDALGIPVMETSALKGSGTQAAAAAAATETALPRSFPFSPSVENALSGIATIVDTRVPQYQQRWYCIKLFERDEMATMALALPADVTARIEALIAPVEAEYDDDSASIITSQRYDIIGDIVDKCVKKKAPALSASDKIDRIVTNRFFALPLFVLVMLGVYFVSIMSVGDFVTGWTNDVLFGEWIGGGAATLLESMGAADWIVSLVVDGIIGGVGGVLGFVPQMIILFILLSFLEDCGYMARVAFIMDRIFRRFGLSGKSFIPMLISSGCGVPGIMATKTIENEKDRRMTIITTTFIPCGAKLPIIALIGGALIGGAWWVAPLIYFAGVASVIISGIMLKKTRLFAGETAPFIMELPAYHLPAVKNLAMHVWERVRSFIVKAGTVIFLSSIVIWFLLNIGFEGGFGFVDNVENSLMAGLGSLLAPLFAPLGFGNWQSSVGTVTGLVAKENLVSTMGILGGLEGEVLDGILDETQPLWAYMATLLPSVWAALSFLLFNMLCAPCFAAIGAIRKQMQSARWTAFAVAYQCVYAYAISLMVYQFGTFFAGGSFTAGTFAALAVLALMLFMLLRPAPEKRRSIKKAAAAAQP